MGNSNPYGFSSKSTAEDVTQGIDLTGKWAIVTGANTGIGYETARVLVLRGANVIFACRDVGRGEAAVARVNSPLAHFMQLDLASFASIRDFATAYLATNRPLHLLINNACPMVDTFATTTDGHELMYGAGHLGPFLLTHLLLDKMKQTTIDGAPTVARIVNLTSTAMITGSRSVAKYPITDASKFGKLKVYSETKLANALFTMELARRLADFAPNVIVACCHPGIVMTQLSHAMMPRVFFALTTAWNKNEQEGAATTCFVATHHSITSGTYYEDSAIAKATSLAYSDSLAQLMWARCEEVCGITFLPPTPPSSNPAPSSSTAPSDPLPASSSHE